MIHFSFSTEDLTEADIKALKAIAGAFDENDAKPSKQGTGETAEKAVERLTEGTNVKVEEPDNDGPAEEPEKPKRRRRTKAQIEADKKAEEEAAAAAEESADEETDDESTDDDTGDDDDLLGTGDVDPKKKALDVASKMLGEGKKAKILEALKEVGGAQVSKLDSDQAVKFLAAVGE